MKKMVEGWNRLEKFLVGIIDLTAVACAFYGVVRKEGNMGVTPCNTDITVEFNSKLFKRRDEL